LVSLLLLLSREFVWKTAATTCVTDKKTDRPTSTKTRAPLTCRPSQRVF
jgi:hypothetical protein